LPVSQFQQAKLSEYFGQDLSWATAPIIEENNPRFFAGHVGVDGGDAGLAQRLKYRSQLNFSDGEVAIDYDVLIRTGKCRPSVRPHCIIKIDAVDRWPDVRR
jgi:hypothetical protein